MCTSKCEDSQDTLNTTAAALTAAAQAHSAAQNQIHTDQCQKLEDMRDAVNNQVVVNIPTTLNTQDEVLKRLVSDQAKGQADLIASTMAAVQDMLTAKMAELQKSLASEVSKMREGNLAMLDAAGITSRLSRVGKRQLQYACSRPRLRVTRFEIGKSSCLIRSRC